MTYSPPEASDLRASDSDRDQAVAALREHAGQGRLDVAELESRLESAYAARTHSDLAGLTRDLPRLKGPAPDRDARSRREFREHLAIYLLVNVALIAIWAASGAGYFWPVWPIIGWGIGVASHASEVRLGASRGFRGPCGRSRVRRRSTA